MKITKKEDHYLLENEKGSYHLSFDEYNALGKSGAIAKAGADIDKKLKGGQYTGVTIDFNQARELGFCKFGVEDFCEELGLDINSSYYVSSLLKCLTPKMFFKYYRECIKLFGDQVFDMFGGVEAFLLDNPTAEARDIVLRSNLLTQKQKHILGCKFAERVLPIFEKKYPDEKRPRQALETKYKWIEAKFGNVE